MNGLRRSDVIYLAVGGAVGVVVIVLGLIALGGEAASIALLLPLAILIGGLLWARAAVAGPAPLAVPSVDEMATRPALRLSEPDEADAPTVIPPPTAPEPERISEQARATAATSFDLERHLVDELADRIQCADCGRYSQLARTEDRQVSCGSCGAVREVGDIQPDTRVRLFADADHGEAAQRR